MVLSLKPVVAALLSLPMPTIAVSLRIQHRADNSIGAATNRRDRRSVLGCNLDEVTEYVVLNILSSVSRDCRKIEGTVWIDVSHFQSVFCKLEHKKLAFSLRKTFLAQFALSLSVFGYGKGHSAPSPRKLPLFFFLFKYSPCISYALSVSLSLSF